MVAASTRPNEKGGEMKQYIERNIFLGILYAGIAGLVLAVLIVSRCIK